MIAKLALRRFAGRMGQPDAPATGAPCNDNDVLGRAPRNARRGMRRVPVCHWRAQPLTGRLECVWQMEESGVRAAAATDSDPLLFVLIVPRVSGSCRRRTFLSDERRVGPPERQRAAEA